jgi:probable F420-dependent oxidoreductase
MRYGITAMATDGSMGIAELAQAVEERGFDSLWLPEHTHIPTSRLTPPPTGDAELPEEYKRTLDPLVALMAAAGATETLRLGTGVLLPAQRDPLVTAKAIATLDLLSGGRVDLGVGFGWNKEEIADHGVEFPQRRSVMRDHVLAMQELWGEDEASYSGDHAAFDPTWSWPKPLQRVRRNGEDGREPRTSVPLFIGGDGGPKLFAHIAEYASGWLPIGGRGLTEGIPRFHAAAAEAGRNPDELEVIPFGTLPNPGKLDHYASLGITRCVFLVAPGPRDAMLPQLDAYAELVAGR